MRKPDFFIVGAPKCGTSSLNDYLGQHPDIFVPDTKDIPFWGSDLPFTRPRESEAHYLERFAGAEGATRVGEACTSYLYSRRAAEEIKEFCPSATIIIMIRNPLEAMYSMHSHLLWLCDEDIPDFATALNAEEDRKQGKRIPGRTRLICDLFYRDTVRYSEQIERYFKTFGREQVQVIVFDDFKRDTRQVVHGVLIALGVSTDLPLDLRVINPNKAARSRHLQRFFHSPPPMLEAAFKAITPRSLHGRVLPYLQRFNTQYGARAPLDPALRRSLQSELRREVEQLSTLLGRDLTDWCRDSDLNAG